MEKATTWAHKVSLDWRAESNELGDEQCPVDLFDEGDVGKLNY